MRNTLFAIFVLLLTAAAACRKSAPLDRGMFTRLLVEIHMLDATIDDTRRIRTQNDKKRYEYYGDIFTRFGISRADFDSCMSYYSRNTVQFEDIYKDVVDSLNRRLTAVNRRLGKLRANDSVNILNIPDTIILNRSRRDTVITAEGLIPGKYVFDMVFKFDTAVKIRDNKIVSYFTGRRERDTVYVKDSLWYSGLFLRTDSVLAPDGSALMVDSLFSYETHRDTFSITEKIIRIDTLKLRDIHVFSDTVSHRYTWTQFVDSSFTSLVVKFIESSEPDSLFHSGKAVNTSLFKFYTAEQSTEELLTEFNRRKRNMISAGRDSVAERSAVLLKDTIE